MIYSKTLSAKGFQQVDIPDGHIFIFSTFYFFILLKKYLYMRLIFLFRKFLIFKIYQTKRHIFFFIIELKLIKVNQNSYCYFGFSVHFNHSSYHVYIQNQNEFKNRILVESAPTLFVFFYQVQLFQDSISLKLPLRNVPIYISHPSSYQICIVSIK